MYFPVAENPATDVAVERVAVDGASIKIWVVNPGADRAVIYFGGNAEDVYFNADDFARTLPGQSVYLVNYRGYGGSSGEPTQQNLFADALHVFDRVAARHASVSLIGRSLGSGIAIHVASERPVARMVLATPHDSAVALAQRMYPVYPIAWMLKDRYQSVRYAPQVAAPTLILMGGQDSIIPRDHSVRLAEAFPVATVTLVTIDEAGHNGIPGYRQYWSEIGRFLAH